MPARAFTGPAPFIVGAPRSGTTVLRLMLDAHPLVAIPPETGFVARLARAPWYWPSSLGRRRFLHLLTTSPQWRDFHLEPAALAAVLDDGRPFTPADGLRAFFRLYAARFAKPLWGDKTPLHGVFAPAIARLLPEARFIHILRDGRDVALSLRPLWFAPSQDMGDLARYWVRTVEQTRRAGARVPHYLEVRYEELVRRPEPVLRRLCAFLDLEFAPAMLAYHERASSRLGEHEALVGADGRVLASQQTRWTQQWRTTQPPDLSRTGRWQGEMRASERRAFEHVAAPLLEDLDYLERGRSTAAW